MAKVEDVKVKVQPWVNGWQVSTEIGTVKCLNDMCPEFAWHKKVPVFLFPGQQVRAYVEYRCAVCECSMFRVAREEFLGAAVEAGEHESAGASDKSY